MDLILMMNTMASLKSNLQGGLRGKRVVSRGAVELFVGAADA